MSSLYRRAGTALAYLAWPALFFYLRFGARTRVLIVAKDHVLLVQGWLDTAEWGLPGGGLHRHELPLAGALREVLEETGLRLRAADLHLLSSEWLNHKGLRAYHHIFYASIDDMPVVHKQRGEIAAVSWFPVAQLSEIPHKTEVNRALQLVADRS